MKANAERLEIEVIRDFGDLPLVECYPGQLNQVFMNLLTNAINAIEEVSANLNKYGRIVIRTCIIDSRWVKIAIADNGLGMPEHVRQKIFDPFFTTKPIGKGTGMGMSISYQIIVEKHRGKLDCFSTIGEGTELVIHIPVKQQVANEK